MGCTYNPSVIGSLNINQQEANNNSQINLEPKNKNESIPKNSQNIKKKDDNKKKIFENKNQNKKEIKAIGKLNKIKIGNENEKEIKVNENEKQNDNKNEKQKEIEEEEQKKKDNELKEKEKLRLLQLENARLEEEKKKKEEEEKEKKEKEEKEKKEKEEKDIYEFEKAEKERLEMTKKGIKEKYQTYLYLLLKNLEAINGNIETLREEINEIFNSKDYIPDDFERAKETITDKVLNVIKTYLGLGENNNSDINIIKDILIISFEERNIDQFKKYLNVILNSVKNYYNLKNENSIINYIIDYLSVKTELKEEVEKKYKEVKIIKYDNFCNITKEYEVAMPDTQMEYLIFKMKSTKLDDIPLMFDDLNVMAFLWFFDENNKKEDNSIKIGVRIREY